MVPHFCCDGDRFIERRIYYTWVDPDSGWQVRFVTRDEGEDLDRIGEVLMDAGYWEACNQVLKTGAPSKGGTVRMEAAREQIQRSREEPW